MHVSLIPWMVRDVFFQMVLANWKNKLKLHESSYCLLSRVSEIMSLTIACRMLLYQQGHKKQIDVDSDQAVSR